uniref:3Beta_HSD domain-containing protein n=1 Tax=Panagrellus redivivus TaxID=6233 RepID=A0A7E4W803_PANRE
MGTTDTDVEPKKTYRFAVIGGGGYLGQVLIQELLEEGHEVAALDMVFSKFINIDINWKKVKVIRGSLMELDKLKHVLEGADACFHLAAYGMSGGASLNKEATHLINVEGTARILEQCELAGVGRFIYTSTVGVVFGEHEVRDLPTSAPYVTKFLTPYAESKCIAEKLVLKAAKSGKLATCALRLRGIYGPGEMRSTQKTVDMCSWTFASFEKTTPCLSQYSGAKNTTMALRLAEISLRAGSKSPANGNPYHIVDDGPPVDNLGFWYPLFKLQGANPPKFRIPYQLVYFIAFLLEWLYHVFKIEPLLTRFEVNLLAITNTYSIEEAKRDFGYAPVNNHCLKSTVQYYEDLEQKKRGLRLKNPAIETESIWSRILYFIAMVLRGLRDYGTQFVHIPLKQSGD